MVTEVHVVAPEALDDLDPGPDEGVALLSVRAGRFDAWADRVAALRPVAWLLAGAASIDGLDPRPPVARTAEIRPGLLRRIFLERPI